MHPNSNEEILKEVEKAENQISDRIADNMETFGVSSTVGRVLGIIYMNRSPMTLDELAESTGMSKTRMSQVMRQMMALNIAEKEFVKGSRKEHYTVESNYIQTFISLFTTNWKEVVSRNITLERRLRDHITKLEQNLEDDPSPEIQEKISRLKQELDDWAAYYDWINRLVAFFESGEILKAVPVKSPESQDKKK
ncbi:GbsR/MarR family transcriptional regulator [Natribacillus halophilus]|uniref:HTH-type transcriptional regulator n=1 Tax=Natribacillus halophilus TaxID=549003 RepID=A0A1G8LKF5_9BACI|nr:GbsR/MarR family transcriptional regulator [Natribacillus halophilus]SDI56192.1 DNA-binding transcriptional regulator GbsR, MarR family [Natribacillus halophilus]